MGLPPVRSVAALDSHRAKSEVEMVPSRNHPHRTVAVEKLSSTKPGPGAKTVGDHCFILRYTR